MYGRDFFVVYWNTLSLSMCSLGIVITQSVFFQSPRQVRKIGVTNRISHHYHLSEKSPLLGME
jgi:hypothetical protein